MNFLLVGEESAGIQTLRMLADSRHTVVGVLASPKPRYGGPASLWKTAQQLGYRTWAAENVKDPKFARQVRESDVDVLLNIHSLFVVDKEVLRAPKIGSFNVHPGPLPRFAGRNPVCWALYFGQKTHGVTLHRMTAEVDAGPIVYQSSFPIGDTDTGLSVSLRCIKEELQMVSRLLCALTTDATLPEIPQNMTERVWFDRKTPQHGQIIWSFPAQQVVNFIRACNFFPFLSPWGYPRTFKGRSEFGIVSASRTGCPTQAIPGTVGTFDAAGVRVACADEWIFVSKVSLQGRSLDASEVLSVGDLLENRADG